MLRSNSLLNLAVILPLLFVLLSCGGGGSSGGSGGGSSDSGSSLRIAPGENRTRQVRGLENFDRWSIHLNRAGTLLLYTTNDVANNIDLDSIAFLYDAANNLIASNFYTGISLDFRICQVLGAGDYYLNVSASGADSYRLHAEFDPTMTTGRCGITEFREWSIDNYGIRDIHRSGITGMGVHVAVVDDGLEIRHKDLAANVQPGHNYVDGSTDPTPEHPDDDHGTSAAGVISASDNGIGATGVAASSFLHGYNLLAATISSDENDADAMTRNSSVIDISSNSWGPPDTALFSPAAFIWEMAIEMGLSSGSNGTGISYVWAGGNGRGENDNSNYDGYANFYGVIATCAVGETRQVSSYSEPGANLWVCAPSNSMHSGITTTDRTGSGGSNTGAHDLDYADADFTNTFGGTSAAAPFISGVVALMREVNPMLTWRDVKLILAQTSELDEFADVIPGAAIYNSTSANSGDNYSFHYDFGFGIVNATLAVAAAKSWVPLASPMKAKLFTQTVNRSIPDQVGMSLINNITVTDSNISFIEHVEIIVAINHTYDGDLDIILRSPTGKSSELAHSRECYREMFHENNTLERIDGCGDLSEFRFGSALYLGEPAMDGNWSIEIKDQVSSNTGYLDNWQIRFRGH